MSKNIYLSWSGGKDSSLALHEIRKAGIYNVAGLITTITEDYDRISMHGVRRALLESQADALSLPLEKILITKGADNAEYENKMRALLEKYFARGVQSVVFGDIFLEDLRKYREDNLAQVGMRGIFPIWKRDSVKLARAFVALGFEAITTCVDSQVLNRRFVGRFFDESFLSDLPAGIDPCGENGEFHSFAFDGPIFKHPIAHTLGEVVRRDRYVFCDLVPN